MMDELYAYEESLPRDPHYDSYIPVTWDGLKRKVGFYLVDALADKGIYAIEITRDTRVEIMESGKERNVFRLRVQSSTPIIKHSPVMHNLQPLQDFYHSPSVGGMMKVLWNKWRGH